MRPRNVHQGKKAKGTILRTRRTVPQRIVQDRTETFEDLAGHPAVPCMLRRVHEATCRVPKSFGGFSAALYYAWDAERRSGTVEVCSSSEIRTTGSIEDADGRLGRELSSIVGYRWPLSHDADDRHRLSPEPGKHPLDFLGRMEEEGTGSTYRIQGGRTPIVSGPNHRLIPSVGRLASTPSSFGACFFAFRLPGYPRRMGAADGSANSTANSTANSFRYTLTCIFV